MYESRIYPVELDSYWDPKERQVLNSLRDERAEAICGPATWEAMRYFCRSYEQWIGNCIRARIQ
jgi:hypothetical protein